MSKWRERLDEALTTVRGKLDAERDGMPSYVPMHVAFLYNGTKLVACASNAYVKHAEINCMDDLRTVRLRRHKPLRLIVAKVSGCHHMSRPCAACSAAIRRRLPRARVFYTAHDGGLCEDCTLDNDHVNLAQRNRQTAATPCRMHSRIAS
jgi:hypothetical protein